MRLRRCTPFYQHRTPKKNVTLIFIFTTESNNAERVLKKTEPNSHKFSKMTIFTEKIEKVTIFRFCIDAGVLVE